MDHLIQVGLTRTNKEAGFKNNVGEVMQVIHYDIYSRSLEKSTWHFPMSDALISALSIVALFQQFPTRSSDT